MNYYKWEALINFLREKETKKHVGGKKKKKKDRSFARPRVELSPLILSNTVYLAHRFAKRVCV